MKVAILSSTTFGLRCLEQGIIDAPELQVVGILTTPRYISISYSETPIEIRSHANFTDVGCRLGCEVVTLEGPVRGEDYLEHLDRWQPDLLLALGWYYNVPARVRERAPRGCLGIHASLLPKYRGGAPIPWAIINGERETGVTLFHLVDEIDAGDIVAQRRIPIEPHDTSATVYEKAEYESAEILRECLRPLAGGNAPRIAQDHSQATIFPQRTPDDGEICWSWDAERIGNFIRAQTRPYPGAFFYAEGKKVYLWDATIAALSDAA